jgi:hypothetical protein
MSRRPQPRSLLSSSRQVIPELGARHPINDGEDLQVFLTDLYRVFEENIPDEALADRHGNGRYRRRFRVFDDPERIEVSVLEKRFARANAQRQRIKWTKNDVGRIKGQVQNQLATLDLGDRVLDATFTQVVRVSNAEEGPNTRRLGLLVEQGSKIAELFVSEHEIVANGITGSLREKLRYPDSDFIPYWPIGCVYRYSGPQKSTETPPESKQMINAIEAIQGLLPITVQIEPIDLFSEQSIAT